MKKLIALTMITLSASLFAMTGGTYDSESVDLNEGVSFEQMQQWGMWECEAQAANGAGGFAQAPARIHAANAALYNCRMYAGPYWAPTCRVFHCGRF